MKLIILSALVFGLTPVLSADAILLVLTNHPELGESGRKTGFYLSEAAHPYRVFGKDKRAVTLSSPDGGFAPIDPKSMDLEDEANASFWKKYGNGDKRNPGVELTRKLSEIDPAEYTAIFFAGGHGSVWDFPDSEAVQKLTSSIYVKGGTVGAVCHGPAALVNVKLPDGSLLISGKKTAVFTNAEEKAVGLTDTVPFLLENEFRKAGAEVLTQKNFSENAVRDGRLVTGQNPASATKAAELFVEAIDEKP